MKKAYKVLIVGAGRIGACFDSPISKSILTHAHAFFCLNEFEIVGFVDIDKNAAVSASKIWGGGAFDSIEDVIDLEQVDVVSLAVPDEFHYFYLKKLLDIKVNFIFAEKPFTKTLEQAESIIKLSCKKSIPILVNYSRRFVPEFIELKESIGSNVFGNFVTGTGFYGKGILHNGSHLVDLLQYFFNEISLISVIDFCFDFNYDDPSVSAILKIGAQGKFFLNFVSSSLYTVLEIDLLFEKARVRITDSGFNLEIYEVRESQIFSGYKNLELVSRKSTQLDKAVYFAAQHIYDFLCLNQRSLKCSAQDAIESMRLCMEIIDRTKKVTHEKGITPGL